ncbi:hypothetical protein [Parvibaculum sp.]|uniref:hypothetical protein n=1 Tax=Parvibaculum sp. TaxID=2024848 RepID=UPI00320FEED2
MTDTKKPLDSDAPKSDAQRADDLKQLDQRISEFKQEEDPGMPRWVESMATVTHEDREQNRSPKADKGSK